MTKEFGVNLAGRVSNFELAQSEVLFPLYESIVNSIQAIEDRRLEDVSFSGGKIVVEIERGIQLPLDDLPTATVSGFCIRDNGIGFNGPNFESFLQSDSTYKASRGGKGVGRFCWLKVFQNADIESNYLEGDEKYSRKFRFNLSASTLDDDSVEEPTGSIGTIVHLFGLRAEYAKSMPIEFEEIAGAVIHHCAPFFLLDDCPQIVFVDGDKELDLNEAFAKLFSDKGETRSFEIAGYTFSLIGLEMPIDDIGKVKLDKTNRVMFCANNRCVDELKLDSSFNGLGSLLKQKHSLYFIGILTSEYLDMKVNANRLSFSFVEENSLFESIEPSRKEIDSKVEECVKDILKDYFDEAVNEREEAVRKYITEEAPQYKPLMKHLPQAIEGIKFGSSVSNIEDSLHDAKRQLEKDIAKENDELLVKINNNSLSSEDYEHEFAECTRKLVDINKASLAEYIAHRKAVLQLFEASLKKRPDEKYELEKFLHELIFPVRATSEDVSYEAHNLWLIDERLTYSQYLASDISLGASAGKKRPDLLLLDHPVLVSDEDGPGRTFESISIFELKRPMRDNYDGKDNPIDQLQEYAEKIKEGNAIDATGRPIRVNENTRIYLYAVCDVPASLEKIMRRRNFKQTPDGLGWHVYVDDLNASIEVLPYDKILADSKMRSRVFFEKLGL